MKTAEKQRRKTQYDLVFECLDDGEWWTIPGIRNYVGKGLDTSISARIRQLREKGHRVDARRVKGKRGLWEYRKVDV